MEFNDDYDLQQPFAAAEFAENPEPRCPCLLLLDTSGSMKGDPISELRRGLETFKRELLADSMSSKRAEIAVVTFGPVRLVNDFTAVESFDIPDLLASGDTPMGSAIRFGLDMLRNRKEILRDNGIKLYRPWIFLITDGAPTDSWKHLIDTIREGEEKQSFSFFVLAVSGANMEILSELAVREPVPLNGVRFREFFLWLSASLKAVSRSNPGDKVELPPHQPYGWADV
jgi:uncharacterized protein YegL